MLIGCPKCGYENFPQHRYCGMCGGQLPLPAPLRPNSPEAAAPAIPATKPLAPPQPVVAQPEPARARNLNYLLEDEPEHTSHRGRNVAVVILLGGLAFAGWHYRNTLSSLVSKPSATIATPDNSSQTSTAGVESTPAPADQPAPAASTPSQSAAPANTEAANPPSQVAPTEQASAPSAADTAPATQPEPLKKVKVRTHTPAPPPEPDETLGENYLYGNGVPQNCTRARQILLAAAQRSNSKAQNVLGTMYATGHCATRDLPTAYHWFARSLHKDPGNTRIEQDLKVLWNQMTPDERNHALQSE